jgi:hypothetical protein
MRTFTGAHPDWLTVIQLPSYAPDLNPAEGVWANMKNGLGNLTAPTVSDLAAIVKNRLKRIQYRPELIQRIPRPDRTHPRTRTAGSLRPWPFSLCSRPLRLLGARVIVNTCGSRSFRRLPGLWFQMRQVTGLRVARRACR